MDLLPFGELPPFKPRQFIPADLIFTDWPRMAPWFDTLETRLAQARSAADLEAALIAWSELSAAVDEEASRRYIAMTCHTDHPKPNSVTCNSWRRLSRSSKCGSFNWSAPSSSIRSAANYRHDGLRC